MNDLINRQEAIDALYRAAECWNIAEPFNEGMKAGYKAAVTIVLSLPAAQPEKRTENRAETHACDLISRAEAIDELDKGAWGVEWDKTLAKTMIESLPSAQPELIRCKNCKHNQLPATSANADCAIFYGMTDQNGFCHMAERRTDDQT